MRWLSRKVLRWIESGSLHCPLLYIADLYILSIVLFSGGNYSGFIKQFFHLFFSLLFCGKKFSFVTSIYS